MDNTNIVTLFQKYLGNQITAEELQELLRQFKNSQEGDDLTPLIQRELDRAMAPENEALARAITDRVERKVFEQTRPEPKVPIKPIGRRLLKPWMHMAAAVLVVALVGTYFYLDLGDKWRGVSYEAADIAPGSNQAVLILADGRTINLSSDQNGIIVGDKLTYSDGALVLGSETSNFGQESDLPESQPLTLSTPKGGQYQITLPDGTNVWLNAASSLRYPSRFTGKTRTVELDGEGYFEVAKNEQQPFLVKSKGQVVKVIGTAFNINAYEDEAQVTTTLVEGAVEIWNEAPALVTANPTSGLNILKPGQQARYENGQVQITTVNVADHVAWKSGRFVFYSVSMPVVMRQIERWYDVSFENIALTENIELWGALSREVMLSQILETIELNTNLDFKQQERRITIYEKNDH